MKQAFKEVDMYVRMSLVRDNPTFQAKRGVAFRNNVFVVQVDKGYDSALIGDTAFKSEADGLRCILKRQRADAAWHRHQAASLEGTIARIEKRIAAPGKGKGA